MAKWYLAAIMAAMGITQLLSWGVFVDAIESYDITGSTGASILGAAIIVGELAAAVGLITDLRIGAIISIAVMIVWSALAVQAFARGLSLDNCGCFGQWIPQKLRWWILLEDAYLLGLSAWLLRKATRSEELPRAPTSDPAAKPVPVA